MAAPCFWPTTGMAPTAAGTQLWDVVIVPFGVLDPVTTSASSHATRAVALGSSLADRRQCLDPRRRDAALGRPLTCREESLGPGGESGRLGGSLADRGDGLGPVDRRGGALRSLLADRHRVVRVGDDGSGLRRLLADRCAGRRPRHGPGALRRLLADRPARAPGHPLPQEGCRDVPDLGSRECSIEQPCLTSEASPPVLPTSSRRPEDTDLVPVERARRGHRWPRYAVDPHGVVRAVEDRDDDVPGGVLGVAEAQDARRGAVRAGVGAFPRDECRRPGVLPVLPCTVLPNGEATGVLRPRPWVGPDEDAGQRTSAAPDVHTVELTGLEPVVSTHQPGRRCALGDRADSREVAGQTREVCDRRDVAANLGT